MPDVKFNLPGSSGGSSGGGGKKSPALKKLTSKPMLIGIVIVAVLALVFKSRGGGSSGQLSEDPFAGYPTLGGGTGGSSGVDIETFQRAIAQMKENDAEQNAMMQDAFNMQLGQVTDSFSQQMQSMKDMYSQQPDYNALFGQLIGQIGQQNQIYQPQYNSTSLGGNGANFDSGSYNSGSNWVPEVHQPGGNYSSLGANDQANYRDQMDSYLNYTNGSRQDLISNSIQSGDWNEYKEFDAYKNPTEYYRDQSTGSLEHTAGYWNDMITRREGMINELISEGKADHAYTKLMIEDLKDTKNQRDNAKY